MQNEAKLIFILEDTVIIVVRMYILSTLSRVMTVLNYDLVRLDCL